MIAINAVRLIEYGAARGLDRDELGRLAGEPMTALCQPGHHIPIKRVYELGEHIMRRLDDPAVPFQVAQTVRMEDLHVMGFAVMTATDGREAFRRAVRYARLLGNSACWQLLESEPHSIVRFDHPPEPRPRLGRRAAIEMALAEFVHCSRTCGGKDYTPIRVSFCHKQPPDIRPHREFFRCPVEFGAAHDEFVIANEVFEGAPLDANPDLALFFRDYAERLLQERTIEPSLPDRVRDEIARELPSGQPTLAYVARRLAMSERSLRRYLTAENTSFSELLSEVRFAQARSLLHTSEVSMSEIAYLLGFSNVSAFSRAFKKWCGAAPSEFRTGLA